MHLSIWGPTGSGKGNFTNTMVEEWHSENYWITYAGIHPDIAKKSLSEFYFQIGPSISKRNVMVERLADVDRDVMRTYIRRSSKSGLEAMRENEEFASTFVETLAHQRRKADLVETPVLNTYSFLLARVYQEQDEWCPEWWLKHALDCRHPIHRHLVRHCRDEHIRHELESIRFFPQREKIQMLYAVTRLFDAVYGKTPVIARTSNPATMDWVAFKNRGGLHYILGGDVAPEVFRLHVRSDFQQTVFDGHRLKRPGYYIFDEVNNYDLWGPFELRCLATVRHLGINMVGQFQSAKFADPEDFRAVLNNTAHVWLPQQDFDMAKIAALDLAGMLDRNKVHHVETIKRQVNNGFREVTHVLKGKTHGEHGGSKSEREQISMVPILETERDERPVYEDGNAQVFWKSQEIMQAPIGTAFIREPYKPPYKIHVPLMKDSWPFGMAQKKVEECIERIKQRPEYETPEIRYPESPTTPLGKKGTRPRGRG